MNCIIVLVLLSCAVALNAQLFGLGLGLGGLGLGGLGNMGGFANGRGFGGRQYGGGASGLGSLGYQNAAAGGMHNLGAHNNRVVSINQADDSGFNNIGGGSAGGSGGFGGNGYNGYQNGGARFGNGFGSGSQRLFLKI